MIDTKIKKESKNEVAAWFQCAFCPGEFDRGYRVRLKGMKVTLCRGCYQDLIESKRKRNVRDRYIKNVN